MNKVFEKIGWKHRSGKYNTEIMMFDIKVLCCGMVASLIYVLYLVGATQ